MPLDQERGGARRRAAPPCSSRRRRRTGRRRSGASRRGSGRPARRDVGLELVAEGGQACRGEARDDAAPSGHELLGSLPIADRRAARRVRARYERSARRRCRRSCRPGRRAGAGIAVRLAGRLSTNTIPDAAGRLHALALERERADAARDERDRAAAASPPGAATRRRRGSRAGRRGRAVTGAPLVPTIVPTSTSGWSVVAQTAGVPARGAHERDARQRPPAPRCRRRRATGAYTCEFESAATEIASGAVPGEPAEPSP